ncbi:MAG: OmpA family protein [Prevotellaceae bacterium]|jgi:outer membrane protein OmpA-like peptidoglycan-associated protein|nr:OmpA family protein [Prevotellaceae bacterium]
MKKNVNIIIVAFCLLSGISSCSSGSNFFKDIATGVAAAVVQNAAVKGGMSEQDASQTIGSIVENSGGNRQAADIGMSWQNGTLNKYDKQNIISDYVFDKVGEATGQQELMKQLKAIKDADYNYLSAQRDIIDKAKKTNTPIDKRELQNALNRRNQEKADVFYSAILYGEERQKQRLQELLPIKQKLVAQGYESWIADEVAATIIGIQKSTALTETEKAEWLRGLGFDNYQEVSQAVQKVLTDNYYAATINSEVEEETKRQQAAEEKRRAEQKAAEERKNAIQKIKTAKIDGYPFDETSLSQNQKSALDEIADILNRYSDVKVVITGHSCNVGYKNINQKKGLKRAEAGKEYLIEKGISKERISVGSKGETHPIIQNISEENRKQNRRIEFVVE